MTKFAMLLLSVFCCDLQAQKVNASKLGDSTLYDNGPIITSLGTGLGGTDESVLENLTLGMTSFGTGNQVSADLRVADDFVVTGGEWDLNSIDLFAYQAFEAAPSITAVNLRIWDGVPGEINSNIVFGDTNTNIINNTSNSGIVRVDENNIGTNDDRQITRTNVTIGITLTAGTYWLDWQTEGTGASGPFVPHITIPGQTITGNALQSADGGLTYSSLIDLGSSTAQGLPFVLNGNVQAGVSVAVPTFNSFSMLIFIVLMILSTITYLRNKNTAF